MMRRTIAVILAAGLLACSPQDSAERSAPAAAQIDRHPVSGLEIVPLTVTSANGEHAFRVEVARTAEQQARGMMERDPLGPNEGMIFPYNPPRSASFWMRNTPSPLDIIFIGPDGRIINIGEGVPLSEEPVRSEASASLILEINRGRAAELGIKPGDQVEW